MSTKLFASASMPPMNHLATSIISYWLRIIHITDFLSA